MTPRDEHRDEDEVWKDIVDRYAEDPASEDVPAAETAPSADAPSPDVWNPEPWNPVPWEDEGSFVPPVPPRVAMPEPPRLIALLGVFGAPALLLVFLIFGWRMPDWASTLLIVWFVGGFAFLIATMKSGPRDPGDDGAVV
ncbi:hypothetical protein [Nocardioides cavernaquae]|uniref:Uncharacterized protein n=1 Tax=Nocardioides cavernaquae TaxID=2321396 RepID=A0A3A5H4L8_9ACTN|nr:hypothetical protein [Nocardioides cavernaquae]RJS44828.1 hypothetical protein D4739_00270 [Nocardioides cavernaquae]